MMHPSKDGARLLARAESMRQAILESPLPTQWERIDLNHMAEAAVMLWEQANDLAAREPAFKPLFSEAISLIFEPLLSWSGRFDLSAKLSEERGRLTWSGLAPKSPAWHPFAAQFSTLCYLGRFQDGTPEERQATFSRAHQAYALLSPHLPALDSRTIAQLAYGWYLMGLHGVALQLLGKSPKPTESKKHFLASNAPPFWREAHINASWLDLLREFE